jgi:transcription antitermination protein NusB
MKSRRKAREAALQALYQCDTTGDHSTQAVDLYFEIFHPQAREQPLDDEEENGTSEKPILGEHQEFSAQLANGVLAHLQEIDTQISAASTHWALHRMCRVDRNILRLATYELLYRPEIPLSVTMNEAIEIAKRFGSDDSPMFINGVLDHVAKLLEKDERVSDKVHKALLRKTGS